MFRNSNIIPFAVTTVIAVGTALCAVTPTTLPLPADPSASVKADARILQSQITSLQQSLAEANAQNARLLQDNTALRRRLGLAPALPAVVPPALPPVAPHVEDDASALFIELPSVKWASPGATDKQELLSHIPGASISLEPFSPALKVKVVNPSHLTLLKASKSLGDAAAVEAGSLFVNSGSLYLQWSGGDQSAALEALRYASLQVRDQPDAEPRTYSMVHAEEISVTLNQPAPAKLSAPIAIACKGKLSLLKPSTDWQSTHATDGSLSLEQNGLKVQIKLDSTGGVLASFDDPDSGHAQHRMDAINAKYAKVQAHLAGLQQKEQQPPARTEGYYQGNLYYPPTVEDRTMLVSGIHSDTEELAGMDKAKLKIEAELDAARAKITAIAHLEGTVVAVALPNGVQIARITLKAGK